MHIELLYRDNIAMPISVASGTKPEDMYDQTYIKCTCDVNHLVVLVALRAMCRTRSSHFGTAGICGVPHRQRMHGRACRCRQPPGRCCSTLPRNRL